MILTLGAIMLGFMGEIPVPLRPGSTWTLVEVGGSRGLINGLLPGSEATTIEIALRGAGLLAFALALMSLDEPEVPRRSRFGRRSRRGRSFDGYWMP